LDPGTWQQMVEQTRLLEKCLGDGVKKVEENEIQARIVQRRGLRFSKNLTSGTEITKDDLMALRPCPPNAISPFDVDRVIGKKVLTDVKYDQMIEWENLSQ
jgi:sialic acid synthase SpsE